MTSKPTIFFWKWVINVSERKALPYLLSCSVIQRLALQSLTNCRGLTHLPTKRENISYNATEVTSANKIPTNLTVHGRFWQPNDLWYLSHYLAHRIRGNSFVQLPTYLIGLLDVVMSLLQVCILLPVPIAIWIVCEKLVKGFPGSWQVVLQRSTK